MYNPLHSTIEELSSVFLNEALNSPQLFSDMAAMESYMAESYGERVFVEMLQNADDAESTRFHVVERDGHVFIANDGKPFDETDVKSICRSGASEKQRGKSIGYRGVGFKSTTHLSDTIYIHSNDCTFSFSKSLAARRLNIEDLNAVPTIRIPFLADEIKSDVTDTMNELKRAGFTTIFIFQHASYQTLIQEVESVTEDYLLFLRHIRQVTIDVHGIALHGSIQKRGDVISIQFNNRSSSWKQLGRDGAQLAFLLNDNQEIVPCSRKQAVFHCYLPTYEESPFALKINSDFSTDPSRKHISLDVRTDEALNQSASLLFSELQSQVNSDGPQLPGLIEVIGKRNTFNKIPRRFMEEFYSMLRTDWILARDGRTVSPEQFKKKPSFLDESEWNLIRRHTPLLGTLPVTSGESLQALDGFLHEFAKESYTLEEWILMMSTEDFMKSLPHPLYIKLYANIFRMARNQDLFSQATQDLHGCLIVSVDTYVLIKQAKEDDLYTFFNELRKHISASELRWIQEKFEINLDFTSSTETSLIPKQTSSSPSVSRQEQPIKKVISRWRAAEQQCMEFEVIQGNTPRDVSKQNLGYDIVSRTPSGEERYIEVKSVKNRGTKISFTNNEYTAAHIHGDHYYICVVYDDAEDLVFEYIRNPLENLALEKVVRQWEWVCEEYNGEIFKVQGR